MRTSGSLMHEPVASLQAGQKRASSEIDGHDSNDNSGRKRITRACDQCNQLRSKCDGNHPCTHCVENQLSCAYERARKKRGRVSKKDQSEMAKVGLTAQKELPAGNTSQHEQDLGQIEMSSSGPSVPAILPGTGPQSSAVYNDMAQNAYYNGYTAPQGSATSHPSHIHGIGGFPQPGAIEFAVGDSGTLNAGNIDMSGYGFPLGDDFSVGFMGRAPMVDSPDWLALTSPKFLAEQWATPPRPPDTLRYPVLQPVLPYLDPIIPQTLACDLLDHYFAVTNPINHQPKNPYVLGYIFRRQSFLQSINPRPCTPALLASMLWISAQHSDASFLTTQPDARARTCQKLLELTIKLMKPLVQNVPASSTIQDHVGAVQIDAGLGGLVLPVDIMAGKEVSRKQVDNIVTYIHLATVVSASERKAASLRWWNAAWSLAREIRLGRELSGEEVIDGNATAQKSASEFGAKQVRHRTESLTSSSTHADVRAMVAHTSEEEREERRRTWWLLYMMDRHLALCYNRPMFFLNKECEGLLQPMDETQFQFGQFGIDTETDRRVGPDVECTSLTLYGFFLPLMVVLGEILDLNHARNRPRFGPGAKRLRDFSDNVNEIEEQLGAFEHSLDEIKRQHAHSLPVDTVAAYGSHIMHVLHILLTGKWDPIALLDDNDFWISSQSFVNATGHAVSAANALGDIVEYDPDLSLTPYFFGIYLLQGSFLLLLFADKLQGNITPEVVRACETIVRAHEACVSTLDNQYQRNFRRVMRSALQQLRGHMQEDATEQQNWRREILKLYRWTGDGTGLAL